MGNKESFGFLTQTWGRDSHGLFDYEFKKWNLNNLKLEGSYNIIYRETDSLNPVI